MALVILKWICEVLLTSSWVAGLFVIAYMFLHIIVELAFGYKLPKIYLTPLINAGLVAGAVYLLICGHYFISGLLTGYLIYLFSMKD